MKQLLLLLLCSGLVFSSYAQKAKTKRKATVIRNKTKGVSTEPLVSSRDFIQWAGSVEEASSEKTDKANSAGKAAGTPNAMPQGGSHPDAWEPLEGKNEYIILKYDRPIPVAMVVILENYMPGAITRVTAYDSSGTQHELARYRTSPPREKSRILQVVVPRTSYSVHKLRLDLNTTLTNEEPQIDAVGIADRVTKIDLINLPPDLDLKSTAERLSDDINSSSSEVGPVISTDGKTLYFSRAGHPGNIGGSDDTEDIWVSTADAKGNWKEPENLGPPLNNEDANFVSSVSPDGNTLLLGNIYLKKGDMKAGASISTRQADGTFSMPRNITIKNAQNFNIYVDYVLSNSGSTMIIAQEPENSMGQRDLYVSFLQDDSTWSTPKTLGPVVNTASDEFSPFLAADERSLYFSTAGRPGFGGADIFLCRRIGDGWDNWTEPQNLGSAINGPGKDAYFTLPASGTFAYFTSAGNTKDERDIFRIKLPKSQRPKPVVLVSGKVVDSKTKAPVEADIVYEDLSSGKKVGTARSSAKTGKYQISLPGGQNYGYVAIPLDKESFGVSSNLDLKGLDQYREVKQDLIIARQEKGAVIRLNNLFFDFNKAELKSESFPELKRMINYLNKFPNLTLEIAGHTDNVGADDVNMTLSGQRAKAVVSYLMGKGINANRLAVKAYGKTKPQATNQTAEGRAINRRVEFVVLEMGTK
jgi:outer membrane protein OmpA-like peptidoglycan-associated protein